MKLNITGLILVCLIILGIIILNTDDTRSNTKLYSGYYNFDNNLALGEKLDDPNKLNGRSKNIRTVKCQRPTADNPFMNPLSSEYNKPPTVYCNSNSAEIQQEIANKFQTNLFSNYSDIYNNKNSQRNWYTVPGYSMPPDNSQLNRWLYKTPPICKEDSSQCLRYVDLRAEREFTPDI
jgi:hypothetical protein